jgi:polysaccharide deacetylase family protein (PEP-CTERM system associated)
MNILTFDIEDWYNSNPLPDGSKWDDFEVRIYEGVERILTALETYNLKGTFFCLGWIAERHPQVIRDIKKYGHHIGCHTYRHDLLFHFNERQFRADTEKAKKLIEDITGEAITAYRAPFFSIMEGNKWVLNILAELGFEYDCSVFPASRDYGGFSGYGRAEPSLIQTLSGKMIKEFPISTHNFLGKNVVFSGGGFFRIFPYWLIKKWAKKSNYLMTYFHPRDFDPGQPMLPSIPLHRKFKSYVGLGSSYKKLKKLLSDFDFVNLLEADENTNWDNAKKIIMN